jgi:hypothetical protein
MKEAVQSEAAAQREADLGGGRPQVKGIREARAKEREATVVGAAQPATAATPAAPGSAKVIPLRPRYVPPPVDLDVL